MPNNTIGEAYIQIKPSMEGVSSEIEKAMGDAGASSSSSFGSKFASGLKTVGVAASAAVGAAAAGVTALTKTAVSAYADFEQLSGGIETLFGEDLAQDVFDNANAAFQTAGLSANEYMETVTGFSASLISSLGENSWQAANYADLAIVDMADNANKMGSSMESIQNAYQGFAKQNYTMLDNLKLGYGGTKEEMERLLRDAEELEGYELGSLDISNFADIVEAIHIVQENLGIAGATEAEAATTISGSIASMQSAWTNLVAGFANGDADLGVLIDNLVNTATTALDNLMPAIERGLVGIADGLVKIVPVIADKLPALMDELLPPLIEAATTLFNGLLQALPAIFAAIIPILPDLINTIVSTILTMLPQLIDLGMQLLLALADGIIQNLPTLIPAVIDVILTIVDKLTDPDTILQLIDAALQIIVALAQGLIEALPKLIEKAPVIIKNLATALIRALPMIVEAAVKLIASLIKGITQCFSQVISIGKDIVQKVKDGLMNKIEEAKTWGKDMIDNFVQGIKDKISAVTDAVKGIASKVKDILGFSEPDEGPLSNFHTFAPDMLELFAEGIRSNVGLVTSAVNDLASEVGTEMNMNAVVSTSAANTSGLAVATTQTSGQYALAGAGGESITIPVYIGQKKIETLVVDALQASNYRNGGR